MLLHRYLETLLGSKTKIKILRTLNKHKEKEFTTRELADYIQISHTGVRKALQDLYEMNAVTLKAAGRNHIIILNKESHLTNLLESLFEYEENTIEELETDIRSHLCGQPFIESAKIFGSVAAGEEQPRSDIDLYIVTNNREKSEEALTELQILCNNKYGNPLTPYILTPMEENNPRTQLLQKEIQKKNIPICTKNR